LACIKKVSLMKDATWKDRAEIVGIAAIVASLMFVGFQMRQDRVIAVAGNKAAMQAQPIGEPPRREPG
jgi:hypothetical protein